MAADPSRTGGFALAGILISVGLVALAAFLLARIGTQYRDQSASTNRRVQADQLLVEAASNLQALPFEEIVDFCRTRNALGQDAAGTCVSNGRLNQALAGNPGPLDALLDAQGDTGGAARICIEVARCELLAGTLLLEVSLRGHWGLAGTDRLTQRTLAFRRARW